MPADSTSSIPWTVVATGRDVKVERVVNQRKLMLRIIGLALIVAAAVTIAGGALARQFAQDGAVEDAGQLAWVFAHDVVQPALGDSVASGNAADLAILDGIVRNKVLSSNVSAVKLYRADGKLIYSNDMSMIGRRYPLGTNELKVLKTGGIRSGISDLTSVLRR